MKKFLQKSKDFLFENKVHFGAVFLPVFILLVTYAIVGIYPFGDKSVLAVDFSSQYAYFFDYLRSVFSGKEGLFYNWSGSLSGGFYATFAYYLASPFNIIPLIFPQENLTEGLLVMLLAKIGAAGFTMSYFLRRHRKYSEFTSLLFAVMFALCGYNAANTINPMWLDGVVALPLIVTGIERICKKRGFLLYTLSLFLAIIANYYIGYMLCVFSGLYFIYYILSRKIVLRKRKIGVFALSSLSAVLLSGFMIMPAFLPLFNGKLDGGLDRVEFRECFNIMDGLLKLFPTVYDGQGWGGLPFIYCGLFALIFAVAYFFCGKFPLRERLFGGIFCGLLLFSMYFKPLDNLWHGGRAPVWFEHRYSFVLIFLLIIFGANAFENIGKIGTKHIGGAFFTLLGILLIAVALGDKEYFNGNFILLFTLIFLAIISAAAVIVEKYPKSKAARAAVFTFAALELFANTQNYVLGIDDRFGYQNRDNYIFNVGEMRELADSIKQNDSGFFRVEKTFHRGFNDNIGAGIYGVSFSSSVYNTNVLEMMKKMGFSQYDWHTRYNGSTMLTDDIFGIKYVMSKDEKTVPYTDKNGIIYENPDALPIAFLADEKVIDSTFASISPFEYQQDLASAISGEDERIFIPAYDYRYIGKNISKSGIEYKKSDKNRDASVIFTFSAPKSGPVYAYFQTKYERTCGLYVNGEYLREYFSGFQYNTAYLGRFDEGEQITVELRLRQDEVYINQAIFCVADENALEEFCASVPKNNVEKTGNTTITATINADKDCALFTTIPRENGWTAYIDGKKCEISTAVNGTLMCIKVPQGEHTITFEYFPEGLAVGLALTACGALLLAGMIVIRVRKMRSRKR